MAAPGYLLTGASSGIGLALAHELARRGYRLALAARSETKLAQLAQVLHRDHGTHAVAIPLDVTDYNACTAAVEQAASALGGLQGVIANAGIGLAGKAGDGHFQDFHAMLQTNLLGAVACLEAAIPRFRAQRHGHLVAIASVAGKRGLPGSSGYCASKAGLISYMESLELELYRSGIATTLLLPGYIDTPLNRGAGPRPFLIAAETGARLIADHIDRRSRRAYVPGWPWAVIGRLLPHLSPSLLALLVR